MTKEDKELCALAVIALLVMGAIVVIGMTWDWYRCGVQQRVWERQGIHMTRWEIFVGADPAQKTITIQPGNQ